MFALVNDDFYVDVVPMGIDDVFPNPLTKVCDPTIDRLYRLMGMDPSLNFNGE